VREFHPVTSKYSAYWEGPFCGFPTTSQVLTTETKITSWTLETARERLRVRGADHTPSARAAIVAAASASIAAADGPPSDILSCRVPCCMRKEESLVRGWDETHVGVGGVGGGSWSARDRTWGETAAAAAATPKAVEQGGGADSDGGLEGAVVGASEAPCRAEEPQNEPNTAGAERVRTAQPIVDESDDGKARDGVILAVSGANEATRAEGVEVGGTKGAAMRGVGLTSCEAASGGGAPRAEMLSVIGGIDIGLDAIPALAEHSGCRTPGSSPINAGGMSIAVASGKGDAKPSGDIELSRGPRGGR